MEKKLENFSCVVVSDDLTELESIFRNFGKIFLKIIYTWF
jgi:hypothetical protein